ncbi:MAG: hypothetical protein U0871_04035 [Gemmataceae bacterium]
MDADTNEAKSKLFTDYMHAYVYATTDQEREAVYNDWRKFSRIVDRYFDRRRGVNRGGRPQKVTVENVRRRLGELGHYKDGKWQHVRDERGITVSLDVEKLASEFGVSRSTLYRLFRQL